MFTESDGDNHEQVLDIKMGIQKTQPFLEYPAVFVGHQFPPLF